MDKGNEMAGTYKIVELVGTSPISFAEAVKSGIAEASKTIRHMDWFEVVEERGGIVDGAVHEFQFTKLGFHAVNDLKRVLILPDDDDA